MSLNAIETAQDVKSSDISRALRSTEDSLTEDLNRAVVGNPKIVQKQQDAVAGAPSVEQLAGAYYMQVSDPSDLNATWSLVEKALESLPCTDFASVAGEHSAHSVQYHKDGFMMARSRLCQLENKGDAEYFVEVTKLTGNGFIFQDQFVSALQGALENGFKPVEQLETPAAVLEEDMDAGTSNMAFLDLSDEHVGYPMIEKWLTSLEPKKGVQYDQMVIFENLSSLAWNLNDSNNFETLAQYKDSIVARVLDILKVDETTAGPTGYFAAKVLEKFFSDASAVPDKLKVWDIVLSLEESLIKWSTPNEKALYQEVPISRGVVTTLLSVLRNAGNMMTGEPDAATLKKSEDFVSGLESRLASTKASWPADCAMDSLCKALRVTCPAQGEEEVQAA